MGKLNDYKYILASASPRRQELLGGLGVDFRVDTSFQVDETYPNDIELEAIPVYLAELKSNAYTKTLEDDEILITADTLVLCPDPSTNQVSVLGKPKDREDAINIINCLSDNTHKVITGVCLRSKTKTLSFSAESKVKFSALTQDEIEYYVDNFNPFDKAGAYAIQEWIGYIGIESIEGSYYNIVGLPVQKLYSQLKKFV